MSSSTLTSIPKMNGTNYKHWAQDMESYIHASGAWQKAMNKAHPTTDADAEDKWNENNNRALGAIHLHLKPHIASHFAGHGSAKALWDSLKQQYNATSLASACTERKNMLGITFPDNQHPGPAFSKLNASFTTLEELQHKVLDNLKTLIMVAKLPKYAEMLHQQLNAAIDLAPTTASPNKVLTMADLEITLTAAWQHYFTRRKPQQVQANKISNVHCQKGDPQFQQQKQQVASSSDKKDKDKGKKKQHHGKRSNDGEKKQKDCTNMAAEASSILFTFANFITEPTVYSLASTDFSSPTSNPRALMHTAGITYPGPPAFLQVLETISLTCRIGVTPTPQTICNLEPVATHCHQCIHSAPMEDGTFGEPVSLSLLEHIKETQIIKLLNSDNEYDNDMVSLGEEMEVDEYVNTSLRIPSTGKSPSSFVHL